MRERLIELLDQNYGYVNEQKAEILADYLLANGVIVPPVSIGQKVWELCEWRYKDTEIRAGKVSMLQQKADKSWKIRITINHSVKDYIVADFGKTVFLTKEEAENALKAREEGEGK